MTTASKLLSQGGNAQSLAIAVALGVSLYYLVKYINKAEDTVDTIYETGETIVTESLNPASENNIAYTGASWVVDGLLGSDEEGDDGTVGTYIFDAVDYTSDWFSNPNRWWN